LQAGEHRAAGAEVVDGDADTCGPQGAKDAGEVVLGHDDPVGDLDLDAGRVHAPLAHVGGQGFGEIGNGDLPARQVEGDPELGQAGGAPRGGHPLEVLEADEDLVEAVVRRVHLAGGDLRLGPRHPRHAAFVAPRLALGLDAVAVGTEHRGHLGPESDDKIAERNGARQRRAGIRPR
jgi:hypothetical protein